MKDKLFDDILKDKLLSLQVDDLSDTKWDALQSRVHKEVTDEAFDNSFSAKLSEYAASPATSDWDSFSKLLNDNEAFDTQVKSKLEEIPATKVSEHWVILQDHLRNIRNVKEGILKLKLIEAILSVSFLLMFVSSIPSFELPGKYHSVTLDEQIAISQIDRRSNEVVSVNSNEKYFTSGSITPESSNSNITHQNNIEAGITFQADNVVKASESEVTSESVKTLLQPHQSDVTRQVPKEVISPIQNNPITDHISVIEQAKGHTLTSQQPTSLPIDQAEMSILDHRLANLAFHVVVGVNGDQIATPYDATFQTAAFDHRSIGNNVGARLSYDLSKLTIETGFSVLTKGYKPRYLVSSQGRTTEAIVNGFETVDYKFVSVPLTAKYDLLSNNRYSVYGIAGLRLDHLTQESFTLNTSSLSTNPTEFEEFIENKTIASLGSNDNFLHYSLGLGVSRALTSTIDLYGQVLYSDQLTQQGIGLSQNTITTVNFQVGIKYFPFK